jgi:hypothetical protein
MDGPDQLADPDDAPRRSERVVREHVPNLCVQVVGEFEVARLLECHATDLEYDVGDTGGSSLVVESGSSYTSFGYRDPWLRLGKKRGVPSWRDEATGSTRYLLDLRDAIDWRSRLGVAAPCVSRRTC